MAIPALANLGLTWILIPRFGLDGAMWATAASYLIGAVASWALGRTVMPLPIPWGALGRCSLAVAGMAIAVSLVPSSGGLIELISKAGVGVLTYAVLALALNAGNVRSRGADLVRSLQGATA